MLALAVAGGAVDHHQRHGSAKAHAPARNQPVPQRSRSPKRITKSIAVRIPSSPPRSPSQRRWFPDLRKSPLSQRLGETKRIESRGTRHGPSSRPRAVRTASDTSNTRPSASQPSRRPTLIAKVASRALRAGQTTYSSGRGGEGRSKAPRPSSCSLLSVAANKARAQTRISHTLPRAISSLRQRISSSTGGSTITYQLSLRIEYVKARAFLSPDLIPICAAFKWST